MNVTNLLDANLRCCFLRKANFKNSLLKNIDFQFADLRDADLSGVNCENTNFDWVNLEGANIKDCSGLPEWIKSGKKENGLYSQSELVKAIRKGLKNLKGAYLKKADLQFINLANANLKNVIIDNSNLSEAILENTNLEGAKLGYSILSRANLVNASLIKSDLSNVRFYDIYDDLGSDLRYANFNSANLENADLRYCNLTNATLKNANLKGANFYNTNLSHADLEGANLSNSHLVGSNLNNANLTGCRIYGISAWDLKSNNHTKQTNLIITPSYHNAITVDDLEVAQFVYLLITNKKIRNVIDTVANKAVLILGRFTSERKKVLNAIANKLRKIDLVPIVFDFKKPEEQDIIETVITLASMCKFIIADVTNARVIADELRSFVPNFAIPVVPLFQPSKEEQRPYASLDTLNKYHWFFRPVQYENQEELMKILLDRIIKPAETKRLELKKNKN